MKTWKREDELTSTAREWWLHRRVLRSTPAFWSWGSSSSTLRNKTQSRYSWIFAWYPWTASSKPDLSSSFTNDTFTHRECADLLNLDWLSHCWEEPNNHCCSRTGLCGEGLQEGRAEDKQPVCHGSNQRYAVLYQTSPHIEYLFIDKLYLTS